MSNYRISSGNKLFLGGVPLHTINFSCDPFDIRGVIAKFGKFGNWQNMVQRVVKAKNYFLARVGTAVVLVAKFLTNYFRVLRGLQAVGRGFFKIATLTKGPSFASHRWQDRVFPAVRAQALYYFTINLGAVVFIHCLTTFFTGATIWGRWTFSTVSTQSGVNETPSVKEVFGTMSRGIFSSILSLLTSSAEFSRCLPSAFSSFFVGYNKGSHAVQAPILKGVVRPVWEPSIPDGSRTSYHVFTNSESQFSTGFGGV